MSRPRCGIVSAMNDGRSIRAGHRRALAGAAALAAHTTCGAEDVASALQSRMDAVVGAEIARGSVPGAVVAVGRREGVVFTFARGMASTTNVPAPMQSDTVFDIASLTKAVATAPSVLLLVEQGKLGLDDPVARHLPDFATRGKQDVRIRHLLAHDSGLPPYTDAAALAAAHGNVCPDAVLRAICGLRPLQPPGGTSRYSCLGYIILGRIVEIASGMPLDRFAGTHLFGPLGMTNTIYAPPPGWRPRIAGTQLRDGRHPVGEVHDPLARLMGGVSGNAGVFSTAGDLARYCRMLLNNGMSDGRRVLSPESVARLTTPQSHGRAFGFDVSSSHAWIKGDAMDATAFCHSGYTGTSIVCDPRRNLFLVILTNRVHPDDRGSVRAIRTALANLVGDG